MQRREMLVVLGLAVPGTALLGTASLQPGFEAEGAEPPPTRNRAADKQAAAKTQADAKPAATVLPTLSADDVQSLLIDEGVNPSHLYGRRFHFTGEVVRIGKGVDGGTVPQVKIDGWKPPNDLYGTAFVHNVIPDFVGKVGDRVKIEGLIVEHGYGTLFVWCGHWTRRD